MKRINLFYSIISFLFFTSCEKNNIINIQDEKTKFDLKSELKSLGLEEGKNFSILTNIDDCDVLMTNEEFLAFCNAAIKYNEAENLSRYNGWEHSATPQITIYNPFNIILYDEFILNSVSGTLLDSYAIGYSVIISNRGDVIRFDSTTSYILRDNGNKQYLNFLNSSNATFPKSISNFYDEPGVEIKQLNIVFNAAARNINGEFIAVKVTISAQNIKTQPDFSWIGFSLPIKYQILFSVI